jgi:hypothetical protein
MPLSLERLTVASVDEQFRILGRERQADLDREAQRFALANLVQREPVARVRIRPWVFRRIRSSSLFRGAVFRQSNQIGGVR